jgi:hypothetical protein
MVRVVVYVTGIALAQFSPNANEPAIVVVASGHHDYASDLGTTHQEHATTVEQGDRKPVPMPGGVIPLIELTAPCPSGDCTIAPPRRIADLDELLGAWARMREDCTSSDRVRAECRDGGNRSLANMHLTFSGDWKVDATIDCYGGYGMPRSRLALHNFVRAKEAWTVHYTDDPVDLGNSIVFFTDVEDDRIVEGQIRDLMALNTDPGNPGTYQDVHLDVLESSDDDPFCAELQGFRGPAKCVVVAIRNAAESSTLYLGGADTHFAPLYTLLQAPPTVDGLWLPVALGAPACPGGGGCCGLRGCIAGKVMQ